VVVAGGENQSSLEKGVTTSDVIAQAEKISEKKHINSSMHPIHVDGGRRHGPPLVRRGVRRWERTRK
jgi:hypothetical protein